MEEEKTVKLYTKFCVECVRGEGLRVLRSYLNEKRLRLEIIRTTYRPLLHAEASKAWGGEDYVMFLEHGKKRIDFDYAIECLDNGKDIFGEDKVNITKKKPARRGKRK